MIRIFDTDDGTDLRMATPSRVPVVGEYLTFTPGGRTVRVDKVIWEDVNAGDEWPPNVVLFVSSDGFDPYARVQP